MLKEIEDDIIATYKTDTDLYLLVWNAILSNNPSKLYREARIALEGGSLISDRMQAEAGQAASTPEWFNGAIKLLQKKGVKPDQVESYLLALQRRIENKKVI
jgi:hypothetical protein